MYGDYGRYLTFLFIIFSKKKLVSFSVTGYPPRDDTPALQLTWEKNTNIIDCTIPYLYIHRG